MDVGVKVKVPVSTPDHEHQATTSQVLTVVTNAVRKALDEYQKTHKRDEVDFELL